MVATIYAVPELDARCNVIKALQEDRGAERPGRRQHVQAMSGDAKRGHGLAPSFWCFDELGRVRDRELLDALITGGGKQPGSLGVIISTQAADDDHPLFQLIDDGLAGLDPTLYVQLHAAPEDADPLDPTVWRSCDFSLGKFLDVDAIRAEAARAGSRPSCRRSGISV